MKRSALAVFDVDGVVLGSFSCVFDSINRSLVTFGGEPITREWYSQNDFGSHKDFVLSRGVAESDCEALDQLFDELLGRVELYSERDGIRSVFTWMESMGLPIHLASAVNAPLTERKIRYHDGLINFIDGVHGGERKSEVFLSLARQMKINPSRVIFITDMDRDLEEAKEAGLEQVFAITSEFSNRERLASYGWPVVESHAELFELLVDHF